MVAGSRERYLCQVHRGLHQCWQSDIFQVGWQWAHGVCDVILYFVVILLFTGHLWFLLF